MGTDPITASPGVLSGGVRGQNVQNGQRGACTFSTFCTAFRQGRTDGAEPRQARTCGAGVHEEVVDGPFGLDVVPVGVVRDAARCDEREAGGPEQSGLVDEPVPPVDHSAVLLPVDLIFAGGILHPK